MTEILGHEGIAWEELGGVEPNPRIETVRKGAELCKAGNIEVVLPIGGGSTIDCAKIIAAGALYDGDAWDLVLDGKKIQAALPIVAVLTLAATGSEMDTAAVISDMASNNKLGTKSEHIRPKAAIMDPSYTETVNAWHTAAGTADIMSHILESYFSNAEGYMHNFIERASVRSESCPKRRVFPGVVGRTDFAFAKSYPAAGAVYPSGTGKAAYSARRDLREQQYSCCGRIGCKWLWNWIFERRTAGTSGA